MSICTCIEVASSTGRRMGGRGVREPKQIKEDIYIIRFCMYDNQKHDLVSHSKEKST